MGEIACFSLWLTHSSLSLYLACTVKVLTGSAHRRGLGNHPNMPVKERSNEVLLSMSETSGLVIMGAEEEQIKESRNPKSVWGYWH